MATYTVRNTTTTNSTGYSWNSVSQLHSVSRYFNYNDLSSWDGVSSITQNGVSADGTILVNWNEGQPIPIDPVP